MKKTLLYFTVFCSMTMFSQVKPPLAPIDSVKKYEYIYLDVKDFTTITTQTEVVSGKTTQSSSRHVNIYYTIGSDGKELILGKKNEALEKKLKTDPSAYAEYKNAMKEKHKFKVCYRIELLGYLGIIGGGVMALIGYVKEESDGDGLPLMIAGGVVGIAGITDLVVFHYKAERHLDKYAESVRKAITIYNENLLAKVK